MNEQTLLQGTGYRRFEQLELIRYWRCAKS